MSAPEDKIKLDQRTQKLLTLLALSKEVRFKGDISSLQFMMVNETHHLLPYRQAVFWKKQGTAVKIQTVSGLAQIDSNGAYVLWLQALLTRLIKQKEKKLEGPQSKTAFLISVEDLSDEDRKHWEEYSSAHALLVLMLDHQFKIQCGLWLDRDKEFSEMERVLLSDLSVAYGFGYEALKERKEKNTQFLTRIYKSENKYKKYILGALVIASLFPVRLKITAPMEIVPRQPFIISVPYDGVMRDITVEPNQSVEAGQVVAVMENTAIENQALMAGQELNVVRSALDKTTRESIVNAEKKAELNSLLAQMRTKEMARGQAQDMLEKSQIIAPKDGVVIFSDANDWRGKPVRTGERIMLLSDPFETEILVRVPIDSMLKINTDIPLSYYLGVSPFRSHKAEIISIGYQATPDPDGLLTYKIRARFKQNTGTQRVGWTGTAKLYGDWTIYGYAIARKPLAALRKLTGL